VLLVLELTQIVLELTQIGVVRFLNIFVFWTDRSDTIFVYWSQKS